MKQRMRTAAVCLGVGIVATLVLLVAAPVAPAAVPTGGWVYAGQFGSAGTGAGQFGSVVGAILYDDGTLYVADYYNSRVEVWTAAGSYVRSFGTAGTGHGQFYRPFGLAATPDGYLYVTDYDGGRVQKVDTSGAWQSEIDTLSAPCGPAVEPNGDLWVTDSNNDALDEFDGSGSPLTTVDGSSSGTKFDYPTAIALDGADNVYVDDAENDRVVVFDQSGAYLRQWATAMQPWSIAVDAAGHVFVGGGSTSVIEYDKDGNELAAFGGDHLTIGPVWGLAVDGKGHLWASDGDANQVVEFALDKPAITTDADGEWHSQDTTVNFSATDDVSGIKELDYSTDGGTNWVQGDSVTVTAPADHSNDGVHVVQVMATSNDGNTRTIQFRVKIDTQPPIVSGSGPFEEWISGAQNFWFTASDVGSGVGGIYYTLDNGPPTPVGTDGMITVGGDGHHTVTYWATDNCVDTPNVSDQITGDVYLDSVPPVVTTVNNVTVTQGKKATFKFVAHDALADHCWVDLYILKKGKVVRLVTVGDRPSKATTQTMSWTCKLAKGSYTWRVVAYDMAGNKGQGTIKKLTVK